MIVYNMEISVGTYGSVRYSVEDCYSESPLVLYITPWLQGFHHADRVGSSHALRRTLASFGFYTSPFGVLKFNKIFM